MEVVEEVAVSVVADVSDLSARTMRLEKNAMSYLCVTPREVSMSTLVLGGSVDEEVLF